MAMSCVRKIHTSLCRRHEAARRWEFLSSPTQTVLYALARPSDDVFVIWKMEEFVTLNKVQRQAILLKLNPAAANSDSVGLKTGLFGYRYRDWNFF